MESGVKTMRLEEMTAGASLDDVEPARVVTVVAVVPIPPDAVQLIYRLPDGTLRERLLNITYEATEILCALNQADRFILAVVLFNADDRVDGPCSLRQPFDSAPGWGVSSWNVEVKALLEHAEVMA